MERKTNKGRSYNGRVILYAIMAGFCVLALIEIIYGRLQSQAKQDQNAVPEDNNSKIVKEIAADGGDSGNIDVPDIPLQGGMTESTEGNEVDGTDDNTPNKTENADMQIVFMGDSILDSVREYDGVAYLISQACNADVYNMSIGGTTAALLEDDKYDFNDWSSCSLLGVVHAILGDIDGDFLAPYRAGEILEECDFSKTDYFVIEYGINDFLARIPDSQYTKEGELRDIDALHTYVGALEAAIDSLHNAFPTAKILLISPHYCQFFREEDDAYIGDSYSLDYGYGPMIGYSNLCSYVCGNNKQKNVLYYNTIMDSGIDAYSADDYLEDGIHLTSAGRRVYAEHAANIINADFRKNE